MSYGLKTFVGLHVAEIQQKTQFEDWKHISSQDNKVADILTKGAPPSMLRPESDWQRGPKWLSLPKEQWSVTIMTDYEPGWSSDLAEYFKKVKCLTSRASVLTNLDKLIQVHWEHYNLNQLL